jgi:outer membrane protein assembly factor BamB
VSQGKRVQDQGLSLKHNFTITLFFVAALNLLSCASSDKSSDLKKENTSTKTEGLGLTVEKQWVRSTLKPDLYYGPRLNHLMKPLIVEDLIIQGNGLDGIVALNRKNGSEVWRFDVLGGVQGAVIQSDRLYFGGGDGFAYCISVDDGRKIWSTNLNVEILAAPLVEDGNVYFQTGNNSLFSLQKVTGAKIWSYARQDTTVISVNGSTAPVSIGSSLLVGFSDGYIASIRKSDGSLGWERQLNIDSRFKDIDSTPLFLNGTVYFSSYDGDLFALEAQSGKTKWQVNKGGHSALTFDGQNLYFSSTANEVLAIDPKDGRTIWTFKSNFGLPTQPTIFQEFIVFGTARGPMIGVEKRNGNKVFEYHPGRGALAGPNVSAADQKIYLMSNEGNLHSVKVSWEKPKVRFPWEKL